MFEISKVTANINNVTETQDKMSDFKVFTSDAVYK